jgi:VWFA-related protein
VQVDAVVVDAQGHTVRGLKREDFMLFDRGKPREIALFEEASHDRPEGWRPSSLVRHDVADNYSARSDRLVILVLDDLHFQGKTTEVRDIARRVVNGLGDRATLGLVTTSGTFGIEATEDRAAVLEVIDAFIDKFDPEGKRLDPRMHYTEQPDPPGFHVDGAPPNLPRFFADMHQFKTLEDVARMLGIEDDRRKAFVWISGGGTGGLSTTVGVGSLGGDIYQGALAATLEALRKSNVASYAVHTHDFGGSVLRTIADASGGFVADTDRLESGLAQIVSELDHYYVLAFYPEGVGKRDKSEYRSLEVRVNQPGLTVRSRKAYQSGPPSKPPRNADPLVALSASVLPRSDLPLRVAATQIAGSSKPSVAIALEVSVDLMQSPDAASALRDSLDFTVLAVDRAKKKVTQRLTRQTHVSLVRTADARPGSVVRYQIVERMALRPGNYQLRVSASSAAAKAGGSVYALVDVIDPAKRTLAIGGLVLGARSRRPIASQGSTGILPFAPLLDREFDRSDELRVFCDVLRRDRSRSVQVAVTLVDDQNVEVVSVPKSIASWDPDVLDLSVPLSAVPAGSYRLRLAVADGANEAERMVGIIVK